MPASRRLPNPTPHTATHTGTCQVCLVRKKLPWGKLPRHGEGGLCPGAFQLPLELDSALILAGVPALEARLALILAEIEARGPGKGNPEDVWANVYRPVRYVHQGAPWRWTQGKATQMNGLPVFHLETPFAEHRVMRGPEDRTLADVVDTLNAHYAAEVLQPRAQALRSEIESRRRLLADWAPHPERLTPLK